jgi:O-acetyl-ADP-ribose deacetylase (regulator of RNase III)
VDRAFHRAGGSAIIEETRRRYPDGGPTGSAVISGADRLRAKHVIHAVGPVWRGGKAGTNLERKEPDEVLALLRREAIDSQDEFVDGLAERH